MSVNSTIARLNSHTTSIDLGHGARLWLIPGVLGDAAEPLFHTLCNHLPWDQPRVRVFGREHPVPRLIGWVADHGVTYRYSGLTHEGQGWPPALDNLRDRVAELTGRRPNGALANLYRDGDDSMGWHRDNEPELGAHPWVLSYNLGAARDFAFRPYGSGRQSRVIPLEHDSLLVMSPQVQTHFEHALPRRRRVREPRLNLTFREIV
jgi:alkylated DNA repair dioxygenase AlkB